MSLFSKAIGWASSAADSYFGTGGEISAVTGFLGADTSASWADVTAAAGASVGSYVSGRLGGEKAYEPFKAPQVTGSSAYKGVSTTAGSFKSTQTSPLKGTGMNNEAVQRAWQKASQYPPIQASLEVVRTTTGKRGPTKSLAEAKIG